MFFYGGYQLNYEIEFVFYNLQRHFGVFGGGISGDELGGLFSDLTFKRSLSFFILENERISESNCFGLIAQNVLFPNSQSNL